MKRPADPPSGLLCTCAVAGPPVRVLPHIPVEEKFFFSTFHGAGEFNSLPACEATAKVLHLLLTFGFPLLRVLDRAVSVSAEP